MSEVDITGQKYNYLTAIRREYGYANGKDNYWRCLCDCGRETIVKKYDLIHSVVYSCGCKNIELRKKAYTKHGKTKTRLYRVWNSMIRRCNPRNADKPRYKSYAQKGISVCDEWKGENGYVNFEKWALESGYDEKAPYGKCTIDRIDNNGNYEPSNCRWVDRYVQANNRNSVLQITLNNETHSAAEWARIVGISESAVKDRLFRQKLPPEQALIKCDRRRKIEDL